MAELGVVLGLLAILGGVVAVAGIFTIEQLFGMAAALVAIGAVAGIPAGLWYHLRLHRALSRIGGAPKGWYWRPMAQHARLSPEALVPVRRWFVAGALGFGAVILGAALLGLAVVRAWLYVAD